MRSRKWINYLLIIVGFVITILFIVGAFFAFKDGNYFNAIALIILPFYIINFIKKRRMKK